MEAHARHAEASELAESLGCSLTEPELADRLEDWRVLRADALLKEDVREGAVTSVYERRKSVVRCLRSLIEAEERCCPHLHFELQEQDDSVRLTITAPPGAQAALSALAGDAQDGAERIRASVRERYAEAATRAAQGAYEDARQAEASCCGSSQAEGSCCGSSQAPQGKPGAFGGELYADHEVDGATDKAVAASLGCGVPTAVADLHEGETVLDLGSGAGTDVLISARRVGPSGKAYGLDMTDEMLELARENQRDTKLANVEWLKGTIESIPLPDGSVDVVISNCVINLSADKRRALGEVARVLRPGGRLAVADVVADGDMDVAARAEQPWTGCIAGALTRGQYLGYLADAGLEQLELEETHRVHEHAGSAVIRARKPVPA